MFCSLSCANSSGEKLTSCVALGARVTVLLKLMLPIHPRSSPFTSRASLLASTTVGVIDALLSAPVSVVVTTGSLRLTSPAVVSATSFQMPMSRPRTVVIQSQPMVAWNVGLS